MTTFVEGNVYPASVSKVNLNIGSFEANKAINTALKALVDRTNVLNQAAGGGKNRGSISLTPVYSEPTDALANTFVGCTGVVGDAGSVTITPNNVLTGLTNGVHGLVISSTNIVRPDGQDQASFIWPAMKPEVGFLMIAIHDSGITGSELFVRAAGIGNQEAYASAIIIGHDDAFTPYFSTTSTYVGTDAASNTSVFTPPAAGTEVFLQLSVGGNLVLCDSHHGVGAPGEPIYNQALAAFPFDDLPEGRTLTISIAYGTANTTTLIDPLVIDFSAPLEGMWGGFKQSTLVPLTFPEGTHDGDFLKCIGAGTFGSQTVNVDDWFILISNKTDCIVWRSDNAIVAMINAVLADMEVTPPTRTTTSASLTEGGEYFLASDDGAGNRIVNPYALFHLTGAVTLDNAYLFVDVEDLSPMASGTYPTKEALTSGDIFSVLIDTTDGGDGGTITALTIHGFGLATIITSIETNKKTYFSFAVQEIDGDKKVVFLGKTVI